MPQPYTATQPQRSEVDAMTGPVVLEFGTNWCGQCRASQPVIAQAMQGHSDVSHIKVEDGSGLVLGRSFEVKLWPTLVFLRDGKEAARLVRPREASAVLQAIEQIDPARV